MKNHAFNFQILDTKIISFIHFLLGTKYLTNIHDFDVFFQKFNFKR